MPDEIKKDEPPAQAAQPSAHVYQLVEFRKDLGPNGTLPPKGAVQGNAFEPEDEYQQLYVGATRDQGIIEPPYRLRTLDRLSQENNALGPCIEALVTNIDGTGYDFESSDEETEDDEDDQKLVELNEFFDEPWPGMSFITLRKVLRRDLERTGNAYLEVLRNGTGDITFLRHVDAKMMRLLRLDDAIPVQRKVTRKGVEVEITVMERQRRYCQLVNGVSLVYFKDFGVERPLNKRSAVWARQGEVLPPQLNATEILHLIVLPDAHTPYGIPRWINQLPSVLGSRKAEEFNLEFFENGGIPPVMIFLEGGILQAETRRALEARLNGKAKYKETVQIFEVQPQGTTINEKANSKVTVERFGADRQKDAMFEVYDDKCETRVRRSFRLPPIFVGQSKDYSFATAFASYTVAEAQVFKPERVEFDEMVTMKLLPAMGYEGYSLKSRALNIEDATLKLQGVEVAMEMPNLIDPKDILVEINKITGTTLKHMDNPPIPGQIVGPDGTLQDPPPPVVGTHIIDPQTGQPVPVAAQQPAQPAPGAAAAPPHAKAGAAPAGPPPPGTPPPVVTTQPFAQKSPSKVPPSPMPDGKSGRPLKRPKPPPTVQSMTGSSNMSGVGLKKAEMRSLAQDMMLALRKRDFGTLARGLTDHASLSPGEQQSFEHALAELQFIDPTLDQNGLGQLAQATIEIMTENV